MTDQTAQEPTMEEILASIRRIISEDDAPADTAVATAPADADDSVFEPVDEFEPSPALMDQTPSMQEPVSSEEDVLELTDRYEDAAPAPEPEPAPVPAAQTLGDLDISEPEPFPVAAPEPAPAPEPVRAEPVAPRAALVGDHAAASAASAFAGLAASLRMPEPDATPVGPTIDAMVRELLRPMLKDWLDANLPALVETEVRKEVQRIARDGGR